MPYSKNTHQTPVLTTLAFAIASILSTNANATLFDNAVENGTFNHLNNTSHQFINNLTVNGNWNMNSLGNFTNMQFQGAQTVGGIGFINMSNTTANTISSDNTLLTVGNALTIRGAGRIGLGQTSFNHFGAMLATQTNTLEIRSDDFTNNGTIRAEGSGGLVITNTTMANNTAVDVNTGSKLLLTSSNVDGIFNNNGGTITATNNTFDAATINGNLTHSNNTTNSFTNGLTINNGTWHMNSFGNITDMNFNGAQTISGNGEILMSNTTANRIYTGNGELLTVGADMTIRGAGNLGGSGTALQTSFINNGMILAQQSNTLTIRSDDFTNDGTLRAEGTGGLNITNTTLTNNTSVDVNNNSKLQLSSSNVNGIFNNNAGGSMSATATTFDNATINGVMTHANNTSNTVVNGITINGSWNMNSLGNITDLIFDGTQTISGNGEIVMSNSTANRIYTTNASETLTIGANTVIRGAGNIGINQTTVVNNGTILAQNSNQLIIDSDNFTNNNIMRAQGSGGINILNSTLHNNTAVDVDAGSKLQINGSVVDGVFNNNGGLMTAESSTFDGATINGAMTQINNRSNTFNNGLTINGSWNMNSLGNITDMIFNGGNQTVGGTGEIVMSNSTANRILSTDASTLTIGSDLTVRGAGNLGANQTTIINDGTILAQGSQQLIIDSDDFTNNNTMRAEGSGGINILNSTLHNNTAVDVDVDSRLQINASAVDGVFNNNGGLMSAESSTFDGATINGAMTQINNRSNTFNNGLTINGSWSLNSLGNTTDMIFNGGNQTVGGTGEIVMSNSTANRIRSTDNSTLTIGAGLTVRGAGNLGTNQTTIVNGGTILAQGSQQLIIDSDDFTNNNIMRAEGSGGINILNSTLHNNTAVDVDVDSRLQINNSAVDGVFNNNGGIMTAASSSFDGATINGAMTQINNTSNTFNNGLTINGSWNMNSLGNTTDMIFNGGNQTVGGTGEIVMTNTTANRIRSTDGSALTVGPNLTIRGSGSLGTGQTEIVNKGTITANQSVPINIATAGAGFNNQGNLNATGGGGINITTGAFTNSGNVDITSGSKINRTGTFIQTAGHTNVDGTLTSSGLVDIQGGLLSGTGLINGDVLNAGIVGPGNSPGQLDINGNYTQTATGTLDIELAGLLSGTEYDLLNITDDATLAGILEVDVLAGFNAMIGDSFDILRADNIFGTFDTLSLDTSYIWQVDYLEDIFGTTDVVRLTILDVSQVPVPGAVWLFGTGLLGLIGVARRKTLH